jgi:hypothetical protein
MKSNGIKRIVMGAFVAVVLITGVGSTTADAHGRGFRRPHRVIVYRPYRPFWGPYWYPTSSYRVIDPIAAQKEEGYNDGRSRGKEDAQDGRENDPENHKQFNKSKSLAYREAFLLGYADGYRKQMNKD